MSSPQNDDRSRPWSVQELVEEAQYFPFDPARGMRTWLRAARLLLSQAATSEGDGDKPRAFLFLYRHALLILTSLPEHPEYKSPSYRDDIAEAKAAVERNLVKLETWKPAITRTYERYMQSKAAREAEWRKIEKDRERRQGRRDRDSRSSYSRRKSDDSSSFDVAAHDTQRRRDSRQDSSYDLNDEKLQGAIRQMELRDRRPTSSRSTTSSSSRVVYHYPDVPSTRSEPPRYGTGYDGSRRSSNAPRPPSPLPPRLPPKRRRLVFDPPAVDESGHSLRPILIPSRLRPAFLRLAQSNTDRDVETCGWLAGRVRDGAIMVTHLLIPDQTGSSDMCDTTEDGDVEGLEYCLTYRGGDNSDDDAQGGGGGVHEGLQVCGWIHTHPSQDCFLSSRDLHTQLGHQRSMPEAIALVCSPRYDDWDVFRLTHPPGQQTLLSCQDPSPFHPHTRPDGELYTTAMRGRGVGHVMEVPDAKLEVVDLRKRKS